MMDEEFAVKKKQQKMNKKSNFEDTQRVIEYIYI